MRSGQAGGSGMRRDELWVGSEGDTVDLLMSQMRWSQMRWAMGAAIIITTFQLEY